MTTNFMKNEQFSAEPVMLHLGVQNSPQKIYAVNRKLFLPAFFLNVLITKYLYLAVFFNQYEIYFVINEYSLLLHWFIINKQQQISTESLIFTFIIHSQ